MNSDFWSNLQPDLKKELESITQIKKYSKGAIVFSEGESFTGFFVIKTGKFKIYNLNLNGKEAILRVMTQGDSAGGPLIFSGAPTYPVTLECMENGSVYYFEANQFKQFLKTHPDYQNRFTSQMMQYMHYLRNKTSSLMLLNLKERILEYLKENGAEHNFISLDISKNQLALLLNATPESISRTFKTLEEEKLIQVVGDTYKLT